MRVLMVHNYYQQPGGEDIVFAAEVDLLRAHGHEVETWRVHNRLIDRQSRARVAVNTLWSTTARAKLRQLVRRHRSEIVHFHNTFPLLSPAVYAAARAQGAATVQTLHNYRIMCGNGLLVRDGQVCERCVGRTVPWPAVVHRCYRNSTMGSATVAAMLTVHGLARTWQHEVDRYIALTEFGRDKHVAGGLPADRIAVKPNFIAPDPGTGQGDGGYALFVGRLVPEKGVFTLLEAWQRLGEAAMPLRMVGGGPLAESVQAAVENLPNVTYLSHQKHEQVLEQIGGASFMVLPSQWYEGFPRVLVEALARGTPVVCSKIGALAELVEHGKTGLHFEAGDAGELAARVRELVERRESLGAMREQARARYLADYTADRNHDQLVDIYQQAIASRAQSQ